MNSVTNKILKTTNGHTNKIFSIHYSQNNFRIKFKDLNFIVFVFSFQFRKLKLYENRIDDLSKHWLKWTLFLFFACRLEKLGIKSNWRLIKKKKEEANAKNYCWCVSHFIIWANEPLYVRQNSIFKFQFQ